MVLTQKTNVGFQAIYDLQQNRAYVNIGISKDTSEFVCDSIKLLWLNCGRYQYPNSTSILMLADSGGSNSCRHYIFKEDMKIVLDDFLGQWNYTAIPEKQ